jgi:hypothetical protein
MGIHFQRSALQSAWGLMISQLDLFAEPGNVGVERMLAIRERNQPEPRSTGGKMI